MIRIIGVLLALAGLIIVGLSGNTSRRAPKNNRLPIGLAVMAVGVAIALFSTQLALMMGWKHP